jgi:hypothetical protein
MLERSVDLAVTEHASSAIPSEPPTHLEERGRFAMDRAIPDDAAGVRAWLATRTMDGLSSAYPGAADVLAEHGVDPRTRCHVAARRHLKLRQVLGRTCPVDDVDATFDDLVAHVLEGAQ